MKAFLSSTYADLIDHRKMATAAMERLGYEVRRMEVFGAIPKQPSDACLLDIEASDVFVGIYAHRYGHMPLGAGTSITEMEFDHAVEIGKPVFCFVIEENYPWLPSMIEADPGKTLLQAFKRKINATVVHDTFTTPEVLAFKIASSMGHYSARLLHEQKNTSIRNQSKTQQDIERNLQLKVHLAYFIHDPQPCYFINATNLSPSRALELTHVWYEDESIHIPILQPSRPLPVRLDTEQSWETWIAAKNISKAYQPTAYTSFFARISAGKVFRSDANLDVPPYGTVPGGSIKLY